MAINNLELQALAYDRDFISTDGYLNYGSQTEGFHYQKRDFLFFSGVWRNQQVKSLIGQKANGSKSLIVGHSDHYLHPWQARLLRLRGTHKIFSTNATPLKGLVTPIPQGLTNNCDDGPLHRVLGNTDHILAAWSRQTSRDSFSGSCYVNFSINTNRSVRSNVVKVAGSLSNGVSQRYEMTDGGRTSYLRDLRKYNFILCPEGNGMDTVRVWETLYMGGFPIVVRTPYMQAILKDLPVVWVSQWKEITEQGFLEKSWDNLKSTPHDVNRLRLSWWTSFMLSSVTPVG
jgi:hypothetical protein